MTSPFTPRLLGYAATFDGVVTIDRTTNSGCTPYCPDTISIVNLPFGYVAVPMQQVTEEGERIKLDIFRFSGS